MASKSAITITSRRAQEFNSDVTIDGAVYHVQTEDMGSRTHTIASRVFLQGEVVFSRTLDYSHLVKLREFHSRLRDMMDNHHKSTVQMFTKEQSGRQKRKAHYLDEIKQLLRRGNAKSALDSLRAAMEHYPEDAFFLSYYGSLLAVVENKPREGIKICKEALEKLKAALPFGSDFFYPVFYLNLGRAYLKDNNKKNAVQSFQKGLSHDPEHHDILWELKKLGSRRKPVFPFLSRSNPINKYIGMLLHKPPK